MCTFLIQWSVDRLIGRVLYLYVGTSGPWGRDYEVEGARIFDPRHTRNRQMIRVE